MSGRLRLVISAVMCLSVLSGCASLKQMSSVPPDINPKLALRSEEAAKAFEARRDLAQFQAAQARWREGNLSACRESLDGLLGRNAKFHEARLLLAQVNLSEEKYEQATEQLKLAIDQRPDDPRPEHILGMVLQAQGQDELALDHFKRAAELAPDNTHYARTVELASRGAESLATDRVSAGDGNPKVVPASATLPIDPAELERLSPGERKLAAAQQAFAEQDPQRAAKLLDEAISAAPDEATIAVRAGVLALRHGQPATAVYLLQGVSTRFADSAAIQRTLGMAHYRQGDYAAAQRALESALSLDKSHALAYLLMGCTLEKLGQNAAAKSHFEQAGRLDPRLSAQRQP